MPLSGSPTTNEKGFPSHGEYDLLCQIQQDNQGYPTILLFFHFPNGNSCVESSSSPETSQAHQAVLSCRQLVDLCSLVSRTV